MFFLLLTFHFLLFLNENFKKINVEFKGGPRAPVKWVPKGNLTGQAEGLAYVSHFLPITFHFLLFTFFKS